jgi:hypothetical protein
MALEEALAFGDLLLGDGWTVRPILRRQRECR